MFVGEMPAPLGKYLVLQLDCGDPGGVKTIGGRGGGKPDLAQGSGKDPSGIDAALNALRTEIARVS